MTRYALVLIAAAAGSLSTASAFASATTQVRTARVSFADLDLSRDAGVEQLYARLKTAAESTCGQADNRDLGALANPLVQHFAPLRREFFRIVEAARHVVGIENDGGGDNRARQWAAPGFVAAGDRPHTALERRTLAAERRPQNRFVERQPRRPRCSVAASIATHGP